MERSWMRPYLFRGASVRRRAVPPRPLELTLFRRPNASQPAGQSARLARPAHHRLVYLSRRELREIKFRSTVKRN